MERANGIDPALREKALMRNAALRLQQGATIPGAIVTSIKGCEVLDGRVAHADEEDQLQRVSFPAGDPSASDLALPPIHAQPA
jgi:hypothetical protein